MTLRQVFVDFILALESCYFNVGKIGPDQFEDYKKRQNISKELAKSNLITVHDD